MKPYRLILILVIFLAGCGSPSTPVITAPKPAATPSALLTPTAVAEANPSPTAAANSSPTPQDKSSAVIALSSTAFEPSAAIPGKYTCTGENISPALAWTAPPSGTKSIALIMDDPDAPSGTWVHWVIYNLPPEISGLPEGASQASAPAKQIPQGAVQGPTSFGRPGYGGPCPPSGQHRYFFHLYAADTLFDNPAFDKAGLLKALEGHTLASAELMGVYQK